MSSHKYCWIQSRFVYFYFHSANSYYQNQHWFTEYLLKVFDFESLIPQKYESAVKNDVKIPPLWCTKNIKLHLRYQK